MLSNLFYYLTGIFDLETFLPSEGLHANFLPKLVRKFIFVTFSVNSVELVFIKRNLDELLGDSFTVNFLLQLNEIIFPEILSFMGCNNLILP